jgi:hypothetical protein
MDRGRVELVRSLFVAMTEQAEALHESAIDGQALQTSHVTYTAIVGSLLTSAGSIYALAKAAAALCEADEAETSE